MDAPSISLCMIVRNEAHCLQTCLDSANSIVSEVIVVDTGSTDGTPELAAANGAQVIAFDFAHVDFSAARNHGISRATGQWILVLDADETLDAGSLVMVKALAAGGKNAGYYAVRHNPSTIDYAVRLFSNRPDYRYLGRVHETVDLAILSAGGRLHKTGIHIHHHCSADEPEKHHRYIRILQEEIASNPGDDTRLDFLAAEYHQLGMFAEAARVAEQIVQVRPLDPAAHLNAGIYHLMFTPDPVRARADFTRALELKPACEEAASFLQALNR